MGATSVHVHQGDARKAVQPIGHNGRAADNVSLNPAGQRGLARSRHHIHPPGDGMPLGRAPHLSDNWLLPGLPRPLPFASQVLVVHDRDSSQISFAVALDHGLHHLMFEQPDWVVGHIQLAMQCQHRDAITYAASADGSRETRYARAASSRDCTMALTIPDCLLQRSKLLEFEGKSDRLREAAARVTIPEETDA